MVSVRNPFTMELACWLLWILTLYGMGSCTGSKQLGAEAGGVKDTAAACQEFKFHSFHWRDGFVITAVLSDIGPSGPILVSLCLSNSATIFVQK